MSAVTGPAAADSAAGSGHLLRGAYSLAANTAVTSALGFAFWVLATHLFPAEVVGRDTALLAAMMELSGICQLNLANALVRFIPGMRGGVPRFVLACYGLSVTMAFVVGACFILIVPSFLPELDVLRTNPLMAVAYVSGLAVWTIFSLQDAAFTGLRRAVVVPVENAAFGIVKLAALPVMALLHSHNGVLFAWLAPMVLVVIPVNWLLFGRVLRGEPGSRRGPFFAQGVFAFLARDYLASILTQAAVTILPLLVLGLLEGVRSAHFAMPFTIMMAFDGLFYGVCVSLVAEGARDLTAVRALTRSVLRRFMLPVVAAASLLALFAGLVLRPFGLAYAHDGAGVLRLLAAASVLRAVIALRAALWRLDRRGGSILSVEASFLVLMVVGTVLLVPRVGLDGAGLAWLGASVVVASSVLPSLVRDMRMIMI